MKHRQAKIGGFTLLEVMIALAILSISLVTLLSANNNAIAITAGAGDFTDAVTLARVEMEKYHIASSPEKGIKEPTTHDDFPGLMVRAEIAESDFPDISEVTITVFKKMGRDERLLFTLTSHLAKEKFFSQPITPAKPVAPTKPVAPNKPVKPSIPEIHTAPVPPNMPIMDANSIPPAGGNKFDKK